MSDEMWLTVRKTAELLGISEVRTYQLIEAGVIPCLRLSPRRIRVPRAWLVARAVELSSASSEANDKREEQYDG